MASTPKSYPSRSGAQAAKGTSSPHEQSYTRSNANTGVSTTVTTNAAGKPTHVNQWNTATGKRVSDRSLPMSTK